jgi:class 3 adenylate cyclase
MFDGPQRAIRCAMAIRDAVQALGIEVRAGLHTGECEVRGDDIGGIAVQIGARVSALAGPNDVLLSRALRDLVIGSGLEFDERGVHQLKGMAPIRRRLYIRRAVSHKHFRAIGGRGVTVDAASAV